MRAFGWTTAIAAGLFAAWLAAHPDTPAGQVVAGALSTAVGVLVVVLVSVLAGGALFAVLLIRHRRKVPPVIPPLDDGPASVDRWHCVLTAVTARGTITLKRGPVDFPALTAGQVEDEVIRRFVERYGLPDGARGLDCRAVPAQRDRAGR